MTDSDQAIKTVPSLLAYFRDELDEAFEKYDLDASEETEAYLVHLLEGFTRIEPEFAEEVGFDKPAAFYLGEAMNSPGDRRIEAYRRLGDASLFNCGFFDGYISRRLVDSDYYQGVGRLAYQKLTHILSTRRSNAVFRPIFGELANNFERVVDAFKWLGRSLKNDGVDIADGVHRELEKKATTSVKSLQAAGMNFDGPD